MNLYLPQLFGNVEVSAQSDNAAEFVRLWLEALGDKANGMRPDSRLFAAAQDHADYLTSRTGEQLQVSMHIGRGGSTANERVRAAGVTLPSWFPTQGNQVESCARTVEGAARALELLINSPAHHDHVMVEEWYSGHVLYGVGAAGNDYVFVSCPKED